MAIVVIGVNHRTAPLELLEQLTIDAPDLPKTLARVVQRDHVAEAVVLSTCNRTEIYAVVERFHDSYSGLRTVLAEHGAVPVADVADHLLVDNDEAAAAHLFAVAAGLESVVVGETEILGQIKSAWAVARDEGTAGPNLNALFRHALEVGKRARTETAISRSIASASAAAVELARGHLGSLAGRNVLVLGAGEMGEQMSVALAGAGVGRVKVANRSHDRAERLAARVAGEAVTLERVPAVLDDVDVLLSSTGAPSLLVERAMLAPVMAKRPDRPLLIVDIAVPRDVDPAVADLPGVRLCDTEDLRRFTDAGIARRRGEIAAVETIIEDEIVRYGAQRNARSVAPVIADLHARAEAVRSGELERFAPRLADLTDRQRDAVEALTHGIVAKLLHQPSVRLGELAGTVRGDRIVDALSELHREEDAASPESDGV